MSITEGSDEMEMDGLGFRKGPNFLEDFTPQRLAAPFEDDFQQLYGSGGLSFHSSCFEPCSNAYMGGSSSQGVVSHSDPLSLHNSDSEISHGFSVDAFWHNIGGTGPASTANQKKAPEADIGCMTSSSPSNKHPQTTDHVLAERKRRAKLSQQFLALTAIVPDIRKMDKVTILEDMIKYIKQLQEREKQFELQISEKKMETLIYMKTSKNHSDSDETFTDELPQIEVKVSGRNMLVKIYCKKRKGVLVKVVEETEKHNLIVVNSGVISLGTSTLDITLLAQIDGEYIITKEDIVQKLHSSLTQFMGSNPG